MTRKPFEDIGKGYVLNSKELCERTGATYRQIDYWCTHEIISPLGKNAPGSGYQRQFNEAIVDKVKLLVSASKLINRINLEQIYNSYEQGYIELDGITLSWDLIEIERGK